MIAVIISEIFHLKMQKNREDSAIKMYILTAKNKVTTKWEDIEYFRDERQFDYMIDSVDYTKYSESMIIDENHNLYKHYEKKEYKPYVRRLKK